MLMSPPNLEEVQKEAALGPPTTRHFQGLSKAFRMKFTWNSGIFTSHLEDRGIWKKNRSESFILKAGWESKNKLYIAVPAEILRIILPLLLGVAFLVLAERKVMDFVQRRKGPNVVVSFGLLQPLGDGLKLILKEPISPSSANFSLSRMAPVAIFVLSLVARAVVPFDYGMALSDPNIGLLYLFSISSLSVYGIIIVGWSSN
nr:NADH-ubiquinone oxidoreductase chain 1-like [Nicotiana tomentosiformis]